MSSIHYKFRSLISYKTVNFETLHVSVEELKKAIFDAEGLSPEMFDFIIENSHTKREYSGNDIIPRNSSLVIMRVPRQDAGRLPKIQDTSTSGIVMKGGPAIAELGFIKSEEFNKMTEEQRLEHVKNVSYEKYQPANYQKRVKNIMSDPPPPNYVCNRCNKIGHWAKNCPLVNIRRTTGLPMDELVETTADDPGAMLHSSGKYMIQKMHLNARLNSKAKAPLPFIRDLDAKAGGSGDENEKPKIHVQERPPPEYTCPICNELISEAIVMTCCGSSFCAECIQNLIIEEPNRNCPGEGCDQHLSSDAMIRNLSLRKAVENYLKKQQQAQWPGLSNRTGGKSSPKAEIEKQAPPTVSQVVQPKIEPTPSFVDLSKPPPIIANNPTVVFPDLSKPPPSFQIAMPVVSVPFQKMPAMLPTTSSSFTKQPSPISNSNSGRQVTPNYPFDASNSPFNQDFSTPPHVETPPKSSTPPINATLPPGAIEEENPKSSPKPVELSKEAVLAFSSFDPSGKTPDLFASLNSDPAAPGTEELLPVVFQPESKIDPVTGKLLDANGKVQHSSSNKRSPRRSRRDSRSPIRKTRRYDSPRRNSVQTKRDRPRRDQLSPRRSSSKKKREVDNKRMSEHKKKRDRSKERRSVSPSHKKSKKEHQKRSRSRTPSQERFLTPAEFRKRKKHKTSTKKNKEEEANLSSSDSEMSKKLVKEKSEDDPLNEEENVIDSLIKEATQKLISTSETLTNVNKNEDDVKSEVKSEEVEMEEQSVVEKTVDLEELPIKQSDFDKTPARKSSNSTASDLSTIKSTYEFENQISIELDEPEMETESINVFGPLPKEDSLEPKEKLSRKSSDEKKSKHKHKKRKDKKKKDKKDHKSEKDKKSKKSKKLKKHKSSSKHRSRSSSRSSRSLSPPNRH